MTLKKFNKKLHKRGQSIFEYFLLTTAVVAVVLFFMSSQTFRDIRSSCEDAFSNAAGEILK